MSKGEKKKHRDGVSSFPGVGVVPASPATAGLCTLFASIDFGEACCASLRVPGRNE